MTIVDLDKLNWPLKRSHFPMHDQSPGAVQGPDSINSSQHIYGLITRQTVFNFLQCYMLCFYCCLDQRKQFFSVTRGRSATSTFCTYCGGCSVPRHIYITSWIPGFARDPLSRSLSPSLSRPSLPSLLFVPAFYQMSIRMA